MEFIKEIREKLKLSRPQFADRLGEHHNSIYRWEQARSAHFRVDLLCNIRKLSRMSWKQFGEMLDKEFEK